MAVQPYKPYGMSKAASARAGNVVWNTGPFMQQLEDALSRSLDGIGRKVEYTARYNVPIDTGLLYSTITYYRSKYRSPTGVGSIVYAGGKGKGWLRSRYKKRGKHANDAYYATWVELGHRVYRKASRNAKYTYVGKKKAKLVRGRRTGGWTAYAVPPKRYLRNALDDWAPALVPEMQRLGMRVVGGRV